MACRARWLGLRVWGCLVHHTRPHTRLFRGRGLDSGRAMDSMETVAVHGSNKIPRAPSWHGPVGAFVRNTVLEELALQWGHVSLLHLGIGGIAWTYSGVLLGPFRYGLMGGFCWKTIGGECCYPGRKPTTINFAGLWSKQYTVAVRCAWSAWTSRVTQLGPRLDQTSPRGFPPWSGRSAPAWCGPLVRGGAPTVLSAACRLLHPWRIYCVRSGSPPAAGDPPA